MIRCMIFPLSWWFVILTSSGGDFTGGLVNAVVVTRGLRDPPLGARAKLGAYPMVMIFASGRFTHLWRPFCSIAACWVKTSGPNERASATARNDWLKRRSCIPLTSAMWSAVRKPSPSILWPASPRRSRLPCANSSMACEVRPPARRSRDRARLLAEAPAVFAGRQGLFPEAPALIFQAQGTILQHQGTKPEAQGTIPQRQWNAPDGQGIVPEGQGMIP